MAHNEVELGLSKARLGQAGDSSLFCGAFLKLQQCRSVDSECRKVSLTQTLTQTRKGLERSGENGDSKRSVKAGHKRAKWS